MSTEEIAAELVATKDALNGAYRERAHLVALLGAVYPSHVGCTDPDAPGWAVVTLQLPTGQAAWHIAPGDEGLFQHVEQEPGNAIPWDGHTTEEKYRRVDELTAMLAHAGEPDPDVMAVPRFEIERLEQQRPALGNAYAAGWTDAIGAIRTPGWAEREAGWKRFLGEVDADPEAYAKAKFAADMERLRKTDPGGARWVERILSERTEHQPKPVLPDRQATLLGAIWRDGGEWAPKRARAVLVEAGYAVTNERAHQIMKQLAERGYLEPVRPRAYTYRLKAETLQHPEPDRSGA